VILVYLRPGYSMVSALASVIKFLGLVTLISYVTRACNFKSPFFYWYIYFTLEIRSVKNRLVETPFYTITFVIDVIARS